MKAAIISLFFVLLCSLSAQGQTTEAEWQSKAVEKYPALGVQGSDFNTRFVEAYTERQRTDPTFFTIPKWPLLLADAVAAQLAAAEPVPEPPAPPKDGAEVPSPAGTPSPLPPLVLPFEYPFSRHDTLMAMGLFFATTFCGVCVVAYGATVVRRKNKEQVVSKIGRAPSAAAAMAAGAPPPPTPHGEEVLWVGNASHWRYFWRWVLGLVFFALGIGALIIIGIFIDRARRAYIVTNRKVIFQFGLFAKSTNEIRIKDIRSINVAKSGVAGLMGIGSVEFSSAATDRAEIVFSDIPGADRIRDMVSRIQDHVG